MKTMINYSLLGVLLLTADTALSSDAVHWSYSGESGPENWAKLSPEFIACTGKNQSPINLTDFVEAELKPIKISYQEGGNEILNNGHTVQVSYATGSSILVDGIQFDLKQFHFHAPSENHINGKSFPLEAHLVHADKYGNLAVTALMFEEGSENKELAKIWPFIPNRKNEKTVLPVPFSVAKLLPPNKDYYRFNGSLTTPPCTEGVRWLVIKNPVSASKKQVKILMHAIHHPNNRPTQPVNARVVLN